MGCVIGRRIDSDENKMLKEEQSMAEKVNNSILKAEVERLYNTLPIELRTFDKGNHVKTVICVQQFIDQANKDKLFHVKPSVLHRSSSPALIRSSASSRVSTYTQSESSHGLVIVPLKSKAAATNYTNSPKEFMSSQIELSKRESGMC